MSSLALDEEDPLSNNYGEALLMMSLFDVKEWVELESLTEKHEGHPVVVSEHAQSIRQVGKNIEFVVLRDSSCTV